MRILLVEDELHLAEALKQILKKNNYTVDLSCDGEDGLDNALSGIYDIIILDIMLPKIDGITVLKEIRKVAISTPVILLTAKSELEDKILGLDSGADDYLTKPFESNELLARIRALGRRKTVEIAENVLIYGDFNLDTLTLKLTKNENEISLTLKEKELLEFLIERKTMISSKDLIIEKLWGYDSMAEDNHVEVYISFLRKKLKFINSSVQIKTLRGVGYILEEEK